VHTPAQNESVAQLTETSDGRAQVDRSDELLLEAARRGELDAFGELFHRYRRIAATIARRAGVVPADIDDVVADAWTRILRAIDGGRGPTENLPGYLATAIRRVAWTYNDHRIAFVPTDDVCVLDTTLGDSFTESLVDTDVGRALARLPDSWREVLWRIEVEGEKAGALAAERGQSANSISAIASRARRRLREDLDAERHRANVADSHQAAGCSQGYVKWIA
jgi:RNA polymerase sigma factor (sigma-70 family)